MVRAQAIYKFLLIHAYASHPSRQGSIHKQFFSHALLTVLFFSSICSGQLISEFTPTNPITAFEILPGGEFVVVASSGTAHPTVLQLRGAQQQSSRNADASSERARYGDEETLEVDLSPDFRDDAAAAAAAASSVAASGAGAR